jgi:hypothetical protein
MTKESPSPIFPNVSTGLPPARITTTTIKGNDLTLSFTKTRGDLVLTIDIDEEPGRGSVRLPLWAIREIRDYCAKEFPPLGPPNEGYL